METADRLIDDTLMWAEGVGDEGLISRLEALREALNAEDAPPAADDTAVVTGWFDRWVRVKKVSADITDTPDGLVDAALADVVAYYSRFYGTPAPVAPVMPMKGGF